MAKTFLAFTEAEIYCRVRKINGLDHILIQFIRVTCYFSKIRCDIVLTPVPISLKRPF